MPKSKPRKPSTSDSDSGPDDRTPVKKSKNDSKAPKSSGDSGGGGDELSWDLGKNRYVKLTEFKGKWYVNIREFYDAGGEMKPTKKGLMLTMEQWQKFKGMISEVDDAIKRHV